MRRFRKIALWILGLGAVVIVLGWGCLQGVLRSSYARSTASGEISKIVGLPVEVESLSVGTDSTTVAIRVPDDGSEDSSPLLRVGSITTDITLGGLLTGNVSPTVLTLHDVEVNLRLDENGKILSPIPNPESSGGGDSPLPAVQVSEATVRIRQKGRPEFAITNVSGKFERDGDHYTITSAADDPNWKKWTMQGRVDAKVSNVTIDLNCERATLRDDLLRSIPYIPPVVWAHIGASGDTAAKLTFEYKPSTDLLYTVDLRPQGASLNVPDADVTLTNVAGLIRIVPGQVIVKDGTMKLADGDVKLTGNYDFSKPTSVVAIDTKVGGVDVRTLPATWGLPKEIAGKLRGTAKLELHISPEGKVDPRGTGDGEILGAMFAGLPAEVKLRLRAANGRYRFDTSMSGGE